MENGDFVIQIHLLVRMKGKLILRRVMPDTTRKTFNITDFEELNTQVEQKLQTPNFEVEARMAMIKHESGRVGVDQHDMGAFPKGA